MNNLIGRGSKVFQKVPLRLVLVGPFIFQIFAVVGLTGWLSFRHGQRTVSNFTAQLVMDVRAHVQHPLDAYLSTPPLIVQINASAAKLGQLPLDNPLAMERHFWQQIQLFDSVNDIYLGARNGEIVGIDRQEDGTLVAKMSESFPQRSFYTLDSQGNRTKLLKVQPDYDARTRPWYLDALKTDKPIWSEIYIHQNTGILGMTAAQSFYDSGGTFRGVMAVNISLGKISNFLQNIKVSTNSQVFIVERNGKLVATSTADLPFIISKDKNEPQRINATASQDVKTRQTAQYLIEHFGNFSKIINPQQLQFAIDGQRQFVQVLPYSDKRGLDWLVVVVIPEADWNGEINANTRTTILLSLLALVLATVLGIYTSRWIAKPIRHLSVASQGIANGDLDQKVKIEGVDELRVLAESFNQMAGQLSESFTALEKANNELEMRVEDRTAQLKEAKEAADAANHAKSLFLAKMSHELRTPLNAILGFTQIMARESTTTPLQQEYLAIIRRSGENLLSLINAILELSKSEAGRLALEENSFELLEMLDTFSENGAFILTAGSETNLSALNAETLSAMPVEWVAALHQAAIEADAELILGLTEKIAPSNTALSKALINLVNCFQFEKITHLTEQVIR